MSSKKVTVQEASPSPPPLPTESLPSSSSLPTTSDAEVPVDQPITSLGGEGSDEEDNDEDEWDPSEERLPGQEPTGQGKDKGKGKGKEITSGEAAEKGEEGKEGEKAHPWQAVWSAEKNAWYFWNTVTSEVTWTNPLDPTPSSSDAPPLPPGPAPSSSSSTAQPPLPASKQFGVVPEIDPALAFLLPPEARGGPSDPTAQSAMFNARTGRFTANDYMYNVDHLDEYNRMKRMNNQYFDQDAWERDMALHNAKKRKEAEEGIAPKPLSKKEMDRFRRMKQEKRRRNQAWLRD